MKIAIVSGYFSPITPGHIEMFHSAKKLADKLIAIVNNDKQLLDKNKKIETDQKERVKTLKKIKEIDEVILSIDKDSSVKETLKELAKKHKGNKLIFCNGGNKESSLDIPETEVCREYKIKLEFGIGENIKDNPYDFLLD